MSNFPDQTEPHANRIGVADVYRLVSGIEAKQDVRWQNLESKLDRRDEKVDERINGVVSRLDRIEGAIGVVRWLGPAGVGAVFLGLLSMAGAVLLAQP